MKKRYLALIGALAFIVVSLVVAQSPYYWTVVVRTFLDVRGKAVVTDSLRVQGTTKLVGAVTIVGSQTNTGLTTVDSLANGGDTRLGGLDNYDGRLVVKNDAVNANVLDLVNSRGTTVAKVDSAGDATVDSLTVNGQSWFGAIVDYLSKVSVKNGLILYAHSWFNSRGTAINRIDSSGVFVVPTVVADTSSFSTTLLTKAIYIPGALPTDIYAVSFRSLASGVSTDALADSSTLGYFAKTDSLIVQRSGAGVIASGSKFSYIRIRMD